MSVAQDIVRTYRAPRQVIREKLLAGTREDRVLAMLMAACLLIFVSTWPRLSREAHLSAELELNGLMAASLFGWLFIAPLMLYLIAAAVHLCLRLIGGGGTFFGARLALFWGLLAATPAFLFRGLTQGFANDGAVLIASAILAFVLLAFWGAGLYEAEFGIKKKASA